MFFDESLFLRNFHAADEIAMIRALGARQVVVKSLTTAHMVFPPHRREPARRCA